MIPGYNHNVKYQDKVYHVQTEDSGLENPHIITHLFVGGNIITSRKTSYADMVGTPKVSEVVVELMQKQHKTVLKSLIRGELDQMITQRSVNAGALNGPAPLNVEAGQNKTSFGIASNPAASASTPPKPAPVVPAPQNTPPQQIPAAAITSAALPKPAPVVPAPVAPSADAESFWGTTAPAAAPPPPQMPEGAETSQTIEANELAAAFESPDEDAVNSIFGEDLISEKSLDEVILSYLSDDIKP